MAHETGAGLGQSLAQRGFLAASRGRSGGLRLGTPPDEINLGAVLRVVEDNRSLVECLNAGNQCIITPACAARRVFREALGAFLGVFDQYTLADLLDRQTALRTALGLPKGPPPEGQSPSV